MSPSLPDIFANAFLCRWDKALINIAIMFTACLLLVYVAKNWGLLLLPATVPYDIITAAVATLIAVVIGVARKNSWL